MSIELEILQASFLFFPLVLTPLDLASKKARPPSLPRGWEAEDGLPVIARLRAREGKQTAPLRKSPYEEKRNEGDKNRREAVLLRANRQSRSKCS